MWSLERIVADNAFFRGNADFGELYMPFDPLLFFADAGNGDQFAFVWTPRRDEVFAWDHETDSRRWVAPSLETYLRWWLGGDLKLYQEAAVAPRGRVQGPTPSLRSLAPRRTVHSESRPVPPRGTESSRVPNRRDQLPSRVTE